MIRLTGQLLACALCFALLHPAHVGSQEVQTDSSSGGVATDSWYPRTLTSEQASAVIYAPQVEAWDDFEKLTAWLAFGITRTGSDDRYYGSLKFTARTDTDIAAREVLLHDVEIVDLSIDDLAEDSEEFGLIRDGFTAMSRKVPLDLVLAYLPKNVPLADAGELASEPPPIYVSQSPALLLFVDGEPRILPVEGTELSFILNTTWDILRSGDDGPLFLCYDGHWLEAQDPEGEWSWAEALPADFANLPATPNWDNARTCVPEDVQAPDVPAEAAPGVFYSQQPAELLLFDGEPQWTAIGDGGLEFASNANQDLFDVDASYYILLSGRWFTSSDLDGDWTRTATLPDAFQDIPPEDAAAPHEKSRLRASIPGTEEAWEAALVASIPRKADIQRGSEDALDLVVDYAGDPRFEPIGDTGIELAVNTSYQVLRYEGAYYLCHNASWLVAFAAAGPWHFADSIPDAFASIPPSSPAYNTTFVTIEGSDDESIEYAYTSGYEGAYVEEGTVVQGTGYAAPVITMSIAYAYASGYPYPYYWWPPTYGYGSWYDPGTGRYGEAVVGYGPYGAAGGAAVYNPETGVYGRGQAVWDNDEFAGRGYAYNPNTNTSIARNRYIDFEDNEGWSQRVARRGDEWRYTESEWEDGRMVTDFESSRGSSGTVARERQGDTVVSEGTINRGGEQANFETTRERQNDAIVSDGTITGDDRSVSFDSVIEDGNYSGQFEGSEGGSGNVDRQLEDGTLSGGSTFTRDGKTIETDVTRTAEGVQREFETGSGGQGVSQRSGDSNQFLYQSGDGDVYAGRDGNVYQRSDDGWSQVQNPSTAGSTSTRDFSSAERGTRAPSTDSYSRDSLGSLERDFQSRQQGFDRYQQRSRGAAPRRRRR